MRFDVNDVVEILIDLPSENLKKGELGVVVMVFSEPVEAYEVEFCDANGETIAQVVLESEQLTKVR